MERRDVRECTVHPVTGHIHSFQVGSAMASAALAQELTCSICLDLYKDPVTLKCGHNFCRVCIVRVLKIQDGSGFYSCPQCKEKFQKRPALQRNITLCNVVENFRCIQRPQETTEIFCTYCVDSPVPALKSCLMCAASLCEKHLRVHSKEPEHVLTDPSRSLEKRKCLIHKKILEYYCTEDATCICVSCCLVGDHRGHNMESLDEASEKKKEKLKNVLQKLTTKRQKTQKRVQNLGDCKRKAQVKASGEAERVTALFIDIRRQLDDLEKKVQSEISRRGERVSRSLTDVIKTLEIEKEELSRKMRHIEELCNMTDPLTVLQEPDTGDLYDPEEEGGDGYMEGPDGGDRGAELISRLSHTLSDIIRGVNGTFYVQDPADISLDIDTAANNLLISDDLKTATRTIKYQKLPDTAERFQNYNVMSSSDITSGRHYWDVEVSGLEEWIVGMCYPSIEKRGCHSYIGNNNKSWGLCREQYDNQHSVRHDSNGVLLPHQISSDRFRIYVDYEAGELSFYELCDPIRHLHTFSTIFTEPLHAVLCVYKGSIKISGGGATERNIRMGTRL
ncbi:E3 ubiquitin/ISG15 ligase TRIM25-like [Engystomops pustulosus]|uniref:E3 ubiquitin/ISG15 ligase TRIM25-like n=1 Tax=Engystomops pustulosus TaxID=76066 RepID=UPI003AFA2B59